MPQGTVKWFHGERGYGFIHPDDGGDELFVHHTNIVGSRFKAFRVVEDGEKVTYEVKQGKKGKLAENVSIV